MTSTNKFHIALCGLGRIGQVHYESLITHPIVHLSAIVEVDFDRAVSKVSCTPNCKAFKFLEDLLADTSVPVDGVVICSPTSTHPPYIRAALNAGKHVFCEKPIAHFVEEVDELYTLAKQKGRHLLCGFQRRYDPHFGKLKAIVDSGKVGKLMKVRSISRDNPLQISIEYLKVSGGIIADTASHDIDMIRYITGEDPESVYVVANAFSPEIAAIGDHDQLEMLYKFPSGVIGAIDISRNAAYGYDQRFEVLAQLGSVVTENQKPTTVVTGGIKGFLTDPPIFSFAQRYHEAYKAEIYHFMNLVSGIETIPRLSYTDIRHNTIILKAAQQSLKEGKPIKIVY